MQIDPRNAIFLIGLIIYIGIRAVFERRTRGNEKALSRADTKDRAMLLIVVTGSLLLPILYLATPLLGFANYTLPAFTLWCGIVAMVGSLWLFWCSHRDLGQNWSITLEIRKGHQLIRHGIYRSIRHPMYASIWLFSIAQALLLQNWVAGWSALVTFAPLYFIRTPREEMMMCEFFGDEYRKYMSKTYRLFPRRHT